MKRLTLLLMLSLGLSQAALADAPPAIGWHWYNYVDSPVDHPAKSKKKPVDLSQLSPTQALEIIKQGYQEALNQAVIDPNEENVKQYLAMQEWMENQSSLFAAQYPKVLLDYPQLDSRIQHPTEQLATQVVGEKVSADQRAALKALAQSNGVLFFYRGGNSLDELMAKIMQQFASINQIALIPVSMDGNVSASFPDSRIDHGQAAKLGVQAFPAVMLVNPDTHQVQPVMYGFATMDELLQRFLLIANNFKPTYLGGM